MGEVIHGDYSRWANDEMLHTTTNYECYKGYIPVIMIEIISK